MAESGHDLALERQTNTALPRDEIDVRSDLAGSIETKAGEVEELKSGDGNEHEKTGKGNEEATKKWEPEPPPDGGYGWVVVACVFWVNAFTWGVNAAYSIYLAYYLNHNVFPGATPLLYSFIGGIGVSQALLIAPLATMINRLYTFRTTMAIGIFFQCGGLIGASFATKTWHLFLSQGFAFGYGMGCIFVASFGITSQWFQRRRGLANGIVTAGSGVGGIIWSLSTNAIIRTLGLAWAFRITAICCFFVNTTATIFLADRNKHVKPSQKAFDLKILVRIEYILVMLWGVFSMLGYIVLLYSLPSYSLSQGLSANQASIVGAMLSVGITVGRPLVGYFSDSVGRINMAGLVTVATGLTCFVIWIPARTFGVCIFFAFINGAICGSFWTCAGSVSAEVVGLANLPSALSLLWLSVVLPCTFSEAIALELRRGTGRTSFLIAQIFTGVMFIIAGVCMLLLRGWKIGQNEREREKERNEKGGVARGEGFEEKSLAWWLARVWVPGKV
ncbi:hypothetical protein JAAARDRAFT_199259 [Jaapia argillacea MUCL 33604]|uniref:Major facilitator superfamily (MFS) profile domain-containing protein n=1 Tax=Jaapia argillacea MUCL 33604 TaxID=933084 RepID=A0A067PL84_9AGAM|nr:hypothetical protein JAAARDRAFT_199259 [Jaapia argillacea MUCL 33604]